MERKEQRLLIGLEIGVTLLWVFMVKFWIFYPSTLFTLVYFWFLVWVAETGFVGFIVLYLLFAKTLQRGWEILRNPMENLHIKFISASTVAGVMAIFISAQGEGRLYEEPLLWVLWAVLISATRLVRS
ncbi:hypothetical protein [Desulfosporosinus fructosivorans]